MLWIKVLISTPHPLLRDHTPRIDFLGLELTDNEENLKIGNQILAPKSFINTQLAV